MRSKSRSSFAFRTAACAHTSLHLMAGGPSLVYCASAFGVAHSSCRCTHLRMTTRLRRRRRRHMNSTCTCTAKYLHGHNTNRHDALASWRAWNEAQASLNSRQNSGRGGRKTRRRQAAKNRQARHQDVCDIGSWTIGEEQAPTGRET